MASSSAGSSVGTIYVIIFIFIAIRIRRIISGTKVSKARAMIYSVWYVAFGTLLIAGSFYSGVSDYFAAIDGIVFMIALFAAHRFIHRMLVFWRGPDGSVYAKGGIVIYGIYVIALIIRLAIDFIYVPSALSFSFAPVTLGSTAITAEIVTDILLAFGAGLLTGRNVRLYQRYVAIEKGKETIPDSPP